VLGSPVALVCDEETAYKLTDHPCELFICGGTHTLRVLTAGIWRFPYFHMKLRKCTRIFKKRRGALSGFESFLAARFAAWLVYRMAGIQNPIEDLDLVELHDAFTISDLQTYGISVSDRMARSKIILSPEMPITSIRIQGNPGNALPICPGD